MPTNFVRPRPAQILARVQADIEGELDGVSAQIRRSPELAHARAIKSVAHHLHGHLAWIAEQIIVDQAAERFVLRWAGMFGIIRKPATPAVGSITVTGTGGSMPAGTEWVRVQDGLSFTTDAAAAPITSTAVEVTAGVGFEGAVGNLAAGQKLQLVSQIAGIDSAATVIDGFSGGADLESLESVLARFLDRIQRPSLGGAPGDHVAWALELSGPTRPWEYKGKDGVGNPGYGKIAVTFVLDDNETDIIPDAGWVAQVQEYLDARSPAEVIVFAPTPVAFATQIDLGDNDTPEVRAAVQAELRDMLRRDAEPGGTIYLSRIHEAISVAAGEVSHNLISPVADVTHGFGEIAVYVTPTGW